MVPGAAGSVASGTRCVVCDPVSSPARRTAILALGLMAVAACGRSEPSPASSPSGRTPGIVLVVLDTLRADALPPDDATPTAMPRLRAFAKGATTFSGAIASAAWTPQSMPSLLTGLTPPHTGCEGMAETVIPALPSVVTTLAERLKGAGYATAAYTGAGFISPSQGLAQGFDVFNGGFDTLGPEACLAKWTDARPRTGPFFLLLHSYAPHDPYGEKDARALGSAAPPAVPPSPALARLFGGGADGPAVASALLAPGVMRECAYEWLCDAPARAANSRFTVGEPGRVFTQALQRWLDGGFLSDPSGRAAIQKRFGDAYRRGLAATDTVLVRTFAALDRAGLPPDTIVVVTSDHGEAHGERGLISHGYRLHDEIVRVPLLVRAPGRLREGAVVGGSCGLVDVVPTLLDLAGLPPPTDRLDGRSLVPLAEGRVDGHPVVSTVDRYEVVENRRRAVREVSVRDDHRIWRYVHDLATGVPIAEQILDVGGDPWTSEPQDADDVPMHDAEFCRTVHACRDEARTRYGLPSLASPCGP